MRTAKSGRNSNMGTLYGDACTQRQATPRRCAKAAAHSPRAAAAAAKHAGEGDEHAKSDTPLFEHPAFRKHSVLE